MAINTKGKPIWILFAKPPPINQANTQKSAAINKKKKHSNSLKIRRIPSFTIMNKIKNEKMIIEIGIGILTSPVSEQINFGGTLPKSKKKKPQTTNKKIRSATVKIRSVEKLRKKFISCIA